MPFVKDPMSLLIESADIDLRSNTNMIMRESTALSNYATLESASQPVVYTAEMVPVVQMDDGFYTEMNFLHPYMKSSGIKSIANALDNVAFVNGLHENAVGLLIESDQSVTDAINAAIDSGSEKKKKAVIAKINKSKAIADKLAEAGIKVKKKCDEGCCGKGCAEEGCENECGTTPQEVNEEYVEEARTAEEYRKQKADAKKAAEDADAKRDSKRYAHGYNADTSVADNFDYDRAIKKAYRTKSKDDAVKHLGSAIKSLKYNSTRSGDGYETTRKYNNAFRNGTITRKDNSQFSNSEENHAFDAIQRHNRRHPDRKLEGVQNLREYYEGDYDAYDEDK